MLDLPLSEDLCDVTLTMADGGGCLRLEESYAEIGRTLTHELYLKGSGFTKKFPPMIVFDPSIEKDHFMVQVRVSSFLSSADARSMWVRSRASRTADRTARDRYRSFSGKGKAREGKRERVEEMIDRPASQKSAVGLRIG